MNFIKLTNNPLSVEEVTRLVGDPACGAISVFIGTTRDNFDGKIVHRLEYEAYDGMAEKEIKKICEECRTKWNVKHIAVHHRLGVVNVQEASVAIAASSEHRRESLDAVSFIIETLKATVPIWKKEVYADNNSEWKENKECSWKKNKIEDAEESYLSSNMEMITEESVYEHRSKNKKYNNFDINSVINRKRNISESSFSKRRKMDSSFVQIVVSNSEVDRRVTALHESKRNETNIQNIQQFCMTGMGEFGGCARTSAIWSNAHLKVTKINNEWGPQTSSVYSRTLATTSSNVQLKLDGVEERICNLEEHLNIVPEDTTPSSIYSRISVLEEKVLFLEGLSPEYFNLKPPLCETPNNDDEGEDNECDFNENDYSNEDYLSDDDDDDEFDDREVTIEEVDLIIDRLRKELKEGK